jgi:hypothetical protein
MKKSKKIKQDKTVTKPLNDGMNTPVPDVSTTHQPSESEAALLKQAENPLGDPQKI